MMNTSNLSTRQLTAQEEIPYTLLLLADETVEAIDKYIYNADLFVIDLENEVVAIYVLQALNDKEAEIKNIAVKKSLQGKGIGTYLLSDAVVRTKQQGYQSLLIGTADIDSPQLRLYLRNGFERSFIRKDFFLLNYAAPIFEDGVQLKDMIVLRKEI